MLLAIVHLLLTAVSVLVVSRVVSGIHVRSYGAAVAFSLVVAVLNAIAWHFLAPLTWIFVVLTLGIGALVVNAVIFLIADAVIDGVEIDGFGSAVLGSLGVSLINLLMHFVFGRWAP